MRKLKRMALRLLLRSFHATAASEIHELQTIVIVALAVVDWMLWAILTFGTMPAFFLTLPTSLPVVMWAHRRSAWLDRKGRRALLNRVSAEDSDTAE